MSKRYNKKKMMSLLMMPWVATMSIGKPVMAAVQSVDSGDSPVNISGTVYTAYDATSDSVSIVLDAGASQIVYYENFALSLMGDSSVEMYTGSSISVSSYNDYGNVIEVDNDGTNGSISQISLDGASIAIDQTDYADGIDVFDNDTYGSDTQIDLTNGSTVNVSAGTGANGVFIGSYQGFPYAYSDPQNEISLSSSTITSYAGGESMGYANYAYANGILVENNSSGSLNIGTGETVIDINDASTITATSLESGNSDAYAESVVVDLIGAGAVEVTLDNGSTGTATATASDSENSYATAAGVRSQAYYNEAVEVLIDESSSLSATATVTNSLYGTADADGVEMTASTTQAGLFGGFTVELDRNSSLSATATVSDADSVYPYMASAFADADGVYLELLGGEGSVSVDLDYGSSISATATASDGYDYGSTAFATGVAASSDYEGNPAGGDVSITLAKGSSVTATATADNYGYVEYYAGYPGEYYTIAYGGDARARAIALDTTPQSDDYAVGVKGSALVSGYAYNANVQIDLDDSSLAATATADAYTTASATATGIDSYAYFDTTITLYNSAITADATATDYNGNMIFAAEPESFGAMAAGIMGGEGATSLDAGSSIDVSATHTSTYGDADAYAVGIAGFSVFNEVSVDLNDSSLSVDATATGLYYADAAAVGVDAESIYGDASVSLASSPLNVTATATSTLSNQANVLALYDGSATAIAEGVYVTSYYGEAVIELSSLDATVEADASGQDYVTANADGLDAQAYYYDASVSLDTVNLTVGATASSGSGVAVAVASGASAESYYEYDGYAYGEDAYITLDDSTLNVSASASGSYARSTTEGLYAFAYDQAVVTINSSTVNLTSYTYATGYGVSDSPFERPRRGSSATSLVTGVGAQVAASSYVEGDIIIKPPPIDLLVAEGSAVSLYNSVVMLDSTAVSAEGGAFATGTGVEASDVDVEGGIIVKPFPGFNLAGDGMTVDLVDSSMTVEVTASGSSYARATAEGIELDSASYGDVTLDNSTLAVSADTTSNFNSSRATARGIDVDTLQGNNYGPYAPYGGPATVDLYAGSLMVEADATNYMGGDAFAKGYGVDIESYDDVTLDLDTFDVTVQTTADSAYGYADADARGIEIQSNFYYDGAERGGSATVTLYNASVTSSARADGYWRGDADAEGIDIFVEGSSDLSLTNSVVDVDADGTSYSDGNTAYADAMGIDVDTIYGSSTVSLDNVTLSADATATDTWSRADAEAYVIDMDSSYGNLTVEGSVVTLTGNATATTAYDGAEADARGISLNSYTYTSGSYGYGGYPYSYTCTDSYSGCYYPGYGSYTYGQTVYGPYVYYGYGPGTIAGGNATIDLDSGSLTVAATATSTGFPDGNSTRARSEAIYVEVYGDTTVELTNFPVSSTALATADVEGRADAEARGIEIRSNFDYDGAEVGGSATVTLTNSNVVSDARAYGFWHADADAEGIDIDVDGSADVTVEGSDVLVTAIAESYGDSPSADADADGIDIDSYYGPTTLNLTNLTVQADATASDTHGSADADTDVVDADSRYGDVTVTTDYVDMIGSATSTSIDSYASASVDTFDVYSSAYDGGSATVTLSNGTVSGTAKAYGADNRNYGYYPNYVYAAAIAEVGGIEIDVDYTDGDVELNLDTINLTMTALAVSTEDDAYASAYGIEVASNYNDSAYDIYVGLDDTTLSISATADGAEGADGEVFGIELEAYNAVELYAEGSTLDVSGTMTAEDGDAMVEGFGIKASGYYAGDMAGLFGVGNTALGIGGGVYLIESEVTVNLDASATESSFASAYGVDVNGDMSVGVFSYATDIEVTASANSSVEGDADASAHGIDAASLVGGEGMVLLSNHDVMVDASAATKSGPADAVASGVRLYTDGDSAETDKYYGAVFLENVNLDVAASASGTASTYAYADGVTVLADVEGFALVSNPVYGGPTAAKYYPFTIDAASESISLDSQATAGASGIFAEGGASVMFVPNESEVTSSATAKGDEYASAFAYGVESRGIFWSMLAVGENVTLDVSATAESTGQSEVLIGGDIGPSAYASASGVGSASYVEGGIGDGIPIFIGAPKDDIGATDIDIPSELAILSSSAMLGQGVTLDVSATAKAVYGDAVAYADGIDVDSGKYAVAISGKYSEVSEMAVDADGRTLINVASVATSKNDDAVAEASGISAVSDYLSWVELEATDLNVSASANGGRYADSSATGIYSYGHDDASYVDLEDSTVTVNASATSVEGSFAEAIGVEMYTDNDAFLSIAYSDVTASASATGSVASAIGALIQNTDNDSTVTLDNANITATATANGGEPYAYAWGLLVSAEVGGSSDVLINLYNSSSIAAVASGSGYTNGVGVGVYDTNGTATINVDETSMIFGSNYAVFGGEGPAMSSVPMGGNVTLNNDGLVAGRVMVDNLYNSESGTLWAAMSSEDKENRASDNYDGTYYFTALNNAELEDGSTIEIYAEDDLGFSKVGEDLALNMVESIYNSATWTPAEVKVVQSGYTSPLLKLEYSEALSTPGETFVVAATLQSCTAAGISENACAAVTAALQDGILGFNSDPEEWFPDPSRANLAGTQLLIKSNLHSIDSRLAALITGENSGDEPADKGLWINLLYSDAEQDDRNRSVGFDGYDADTTGVIVGFDGYVNDSTIMGMAITYGETDADANTDLAEFDMDELLFTLYGDYECPESDWFGKAQLTYGVGEVDSERTNAGFVLKGSYDTDVIYGRVEMGKHIGAGSWVLSPQASIDYALIQFDKYTEKGGFLPLEVEYQDYDELNIGLGAKLAKADGMFRPEVKAVVYYDVIGDDLEAKSNFVGSTTKFVTQGADSDELSWDLGVALTIEGDDSPVSIKIGYDLIGSEDFTSNNFNAKLRYEF